jgi:hypothetical protein
MTAIELSKEIDPRRHRFLGAAAMTIAAAPLGMIGAANASSAWGG